MESSATPPAAAPRPPSERATPPWLSRAWEKPLFVLVAVALLAGLVAGWREFWFLTDDAHITFRYISNHHLGRGYTWNPPPFKPVEGYSNFLWMVLLDYVWRLTGVDPPGSANLVSLIFSVGTLVVAFLAVFELRVPSSWERWRPWLGLLAVASLVVNRTFLTWTSSGLETALFVFCCGCWVWCALKVAHGRGARWMTATVTSAAATMLTRPDGGLFVLTTLVLALENLRQARKAGRPLRPWLTSLTPLLLVLVHLIWRRAFYGEWAPNTYYAKFVYPWPEAGLRYTLSFAIEHGLLFWAIPGLVVLARFLKSPEVKGRLRQALGERLAVLLVAAPFVFHVAYYTLIIGGDHFEYRIYAHLLLPMALCLVVWVTALVRQPARGGAVFLGIVVLQQPVGWVHHAKTRHLTTRGETFKLTVPIAEAFPPGPLRAYVHGFDLLQAWMQHRHIGTRQLEHKVFFLTTMRDFPPREEGATIPWEPGHPVYWGACVGGSSWHLPNVAIIDVLGLNDYVVARTPLPSVPRLRIMAHERVSPPGYLECFQSNISVEGGRATVRERPRPFTERDITLCEDRFRQALPR